MGSFSIWHWLIFAAIAWFVWRVMRGGVQRAGAARPTTAPAAEPQRYDRIRGDGRYSAEVVGESFYADNFRRVLGAKAGTEGEMFGDAVLRLEADNPHDSQAVGVYVQGLKLGHLPRELAREFRQALARDGVAGRSEYAVGARLYCGGADETFSVSLDLPQT